MSGLLERLSDEFSLPLRDLVYLIRSAPYRYKVYPIPKRTPGEFRTIAQPARELKPLQRWVMRNVLSEYPVHEAALAYRKGRNIYENANRHVGHRFLCKLDFRNFFPSIRSKDFELLIRSTENVQQWTDEEVDYLCRILFWRKKRSDNLELSIGAPSSPMVSNILLYRFDFALSELCNEMGVTYTRYADDLTFSTNQARVLRRIEEQIPKICTAIGSPRLLLNRKKTVHTSKKSSRRVTGLVLSNDGVVSLGRDRKRMIRAAFHRYTTGTLNDLEIMQLAGTLSFVNSVEPAFLERLSAKYGADSVAHLIATRRRLGS